MLLTRSSVTNLALIFAINFNLHAGGCIYSNTSVRLPPLGRPMRQEFFMEPDFIQLNHGSYGTYPKAVFQALHTYQLRAERNPDLWLRHDVKNELEKVRALLASLVNADEEDLVMVPNTTGGINAILRSMSFAPGERILHLSTIYSSMSSIIQYLIDSRNGTISRLVFNATYPMDNKVFLKKFEAFLVQNHDQKPENPVKLALIDHISSVPAVVIPIEKVIPMLKRRRIQVLIDGAHGIGQVPIDIKALAPDYYVTNCHKWLYSARGSALLYVDKIHQGSVHPAHINSGYSQPANFQKEFFWTGTMDYSPYMTIPTALHFRQQVGGEELIRKYNHKLAFEGGHLMAQRFHTEVLQSKEQIGSMVDIRLPVWNPDDPALSPDWWTDEQLYNHPNTFSPVYKHNRQWWVRISAQIYNDLSDFEFSAQHFLRICRELNTSQGQNVTSKFNKYDNKLLST